MCSACIPMSCCCSFCRGCFQAWERLSCGDAGPCLALACVDLRNFAPIPAPVRLLLPSGSPCAPPMPCAAACHRDGVGTWFAGCILRTASVSQSEMQPGYQILKCQTPCHPPADRRERLTLWVSLEEELTRYNICRRQALLALVGKLVPTPLP